MDIYSYTRFVVVGTTSSGKSTLAKQLSDLIKADFVELDALHWEPNWVEARPDVFRHRVDVATRSMRWVVAGSYNAVRDIIWKQAEVIIWLDYPFHIIFWRLFNRTIRRAISQEELWNGNREKFWVHFKFWSEDSLFLWLFKTYWRRKREYPILFASPEYAHIKVVHFKHPREVALWLKNISEKSL